MAKVTFEFDENEDRSDINEIVNRHKLLSALYEIRNLRRTLYKGYYNENDYISVLTENYKPIRMITDEEHREANLKGETIKGTVGYVREEYIIDEIDRVLSDVYDLLD